MSIHESGATCPGCDLKLTQAHPYLRTWFKDYVKPRWPHTHVSWSYRDREGQERAYRNHATRLHFPNSAHNYMEGGEPCSLALDLFVIDADNIATFPPMLYAVINRMNEEKEFPLIWGGRFKTIGDADHFQLDLSKAKFVA